MATLPNFPAIRPSLLLDFANSARVDPRLAGFRASTATCFGPDGRLRTVGVNTPRINFDPLTGKCLGLLVEGEARTNQLWFSTTFGVGASGWYTGANTTLGVGAGAPDGGPTTIIKNTASVNAFHGSSYSANAGQSVTQSVWWRGTSKPSIGNVVAIDYFDQSQASQRTYLAFSDARVIADGRWRRYSLTVTTHKTAGGVGTYFCVDTGVFNGEMWGPQVEIGASASSNILTTGASAVTRAAESVSMPLSSVFNQSEGSIVAEFSLEETSSDVGTILNIRDATGYLSRLQLRESRLIPGVDFFAMTGETTVIDTEGRAVVVGKYHKSAARYKTGDSGFSLDGLPVLSGAGAIFPFANEFSLIILGESMMGHIQRLCLYGSALTNPQLEALST